MEGFAKEVGLVGGDHVDEVNDLVAVAPWTQKVGAVGGVAVHAQGAQTSAQARLQQHFLGWRHADAGRALDEIGQSGELPRR